MGTGWSSCVPSLWRQNRSSVNLRQPRASVQTATVGSGINRCARPKGLRSTSGLEGDTTMAGAGKIRFTRRRLADGLEGPKPEEQDVPPPKPPPSISFPPRQEYPSLSLRDLLEARDQY